MNRKINNSFNKRNDNFQVRKTIIIWIVIIVFSIIVMKLFHNQQNQTENPTYSEFCRDVEEKKIDLAILRGNKLKGKYNPDYKSGKKFSLIIPREDINLYSIMRENIKNFRIKHANNIFPNILLSIIPILVIVSLVWFLLSIQLRGVGRGAMRFGKSRARMFNKEREFITFADVEGVNEAKEELQEVVEFLKDPKKFQKLGGRMPKGMLLMGPPGTGKTLLAKAIAGEAQVPFLSISGSDFVEMFAGVGASRVRDLFKKAKRNAPCIIFLDELDAIGRYRSKWVEGGHDEREHTLNALLVEMDGFNTQEGIIIIAATNRPDILDPALLRPGRFDRQIVIDLPDLHGRIGILKVHCGKISLATGVDLERVARGTPGFSGADLANLVNESALRAARLGKSCVELSDFEESRDKVKWGKERRSIIVDEEDRKISAFHEAGHALVLHLIPEVEPLHKVTVIPRGIAYLGATMQLPKKDKYTETRTQLLGEITGLMGGRVAEEIVFNDISNGSSNDIERATKIAKMMVCEWGMSDKIGLIKLGDHDEQVFLKKDGHIRGDYSESTAIEIDNEIKVIIETCYKRAKEIIKVNEGALLKIAENLLQKEVLDGSEIEEIVNQSKSKKFSGKASVKDMTNV